jgi:hypothetical protein
VGELTEAHAVAAQVAAVNVHPAATAQLLAVGVVTPAHVVAVVVDAAVHPAAVKMQRLTLRQLLTLAVADRLAQKVVAVLVAAQAATAGAV